VAFLSFLENGRKKGSLDTYHRLAGALSVPLEALFKDLAPANLPPAPDYPLSMQGMTAAEKRAIYRLINTLRRTRR
jgi:transcriptional regulator with XRE-family HTH domain